MNQRHEVFADYEEKHLRAVVLHAQADDDYLYHDAGYTSKVSKAEVWNLFTKGLMRVYFQGAMYNPTHCKDDGQNAIITVHDAEGNFSFKSAEFNS